MSSPDAEPVRDPVTVRLQGLGDLAQTLQGAVLEGFSELYGFAVAMTADHQRSQRPTRTWDIDLRCATHANTLPAKFTQVATCPDCSFREVYHCINPNCREEEWPCATRVALERDLGSSGAES